MDDKNQTNQDSVNETTLFENEANEDSVDETTPSENDKSNNKKLSRFKKILLVGLGIVLIGIVVSIFAMTVGIVIGVIGAGQESDILKAHVSAYEFASPKSIIDKENS